MSKLSQKPSRSERQILHGRPRNSKRAKPYARKLMKILTKMDCKVSFDTAATRTTTIGTGRQGQSDSQVTASCCSVSYCTWIAGVISSSFPGSQSDVQVTSRRQDDKIHVRFFFDALSLFVSHINHRLVNAVTICHGRHLR